MVAGEMGRVWAMWEPPHPFQLVGAEVLGVGAWGDKSKGLVQSWDGASFPEPIKIEILSRGGRGNGACLGPKGAYLPIPDHWHGRRERRRAGGLI